jgi:hypothetical protein
MANLAEADVVVYVRCVQGHRGRDAAVPNPRSVAADRGVVAGRHEEQDFTVLFAPLAGDAILGVKRKRRKALEAVSACASWLACAHAAAAPAAAAAAARRVSVLGGHVVQLDLGRRGAAVEGLAHGDRLARGGERERVHNNTAVREQLLYCTQDK